METNLQSDVLCSRDLRRRMRCGRQAAAPAPDSGPQPKLLSDLSTVSDVPINPLAAKATPARAEGMLHDSSLDAVTPGPRTFQTDPGISRVVGNEANPGTVRLLNAKAAQFGDFSALILDRIYARLIEAERSEKFQEPGCPPISGPLLSPRS